jgi:hypothetical protein
MGSKDNPFVVTGPVFGTSNTSTADLVLSGDGTPANPYVISVNVHLPLDGLTDVNAPAPVAGYVLTYATSPSPGWIAAIPQSGTPGAVLHDNTLQGAGTAGSVLGVLLDPTGGITAGASGLKAGTGWTVCTSGTRPASPAAYDKIIESDTQAWGFWMPGTPGKWRMYDTKSQSWTPRWTSLPRVTVRNAHAGCLLRQNSCPHHGLTSWAALNMRMRPAHCRHPGCDQVHLDHPGQPVGQWMGPRLGLGLLASPGRLPPEQHHPHVGVQPRRGAHLGGAQRRLLEPAGYWRASASGGVAVPGRLRLLW